MLVRYFVELDHPVSAIEAVLTREPQAWLPEIVERVSDRGLELTSRVGVNVRGTRLQKRVKLTISAPTRVGDAIMLAIDWKPTRSAHLVPTLEGEIEVAPLGPGRTQLAISASYHPPLGMVGAAADRALLRRLAEGTVKDFLDHVAAGVEALLAESLHPAAAANGSGPVGAR